MSSRDNVCGKSFLFLVFASLLLGDSPAWAQTTGAAISGVVEDSTGARVPGVSLEIKNTDTGVSRAVTTDAEGRYTAPNLSLGRYQVTGSLAGFQTAVRTGITLSVGREAVVNLVLQIGAVTEQVEVSGEAPLVNTTSAVVGELVGEHEISELPLNGRSFEQLAFLEPGVLFARGASSDPGADRGAGGRKLSIAGTRPEFTTFRLDGTDMIDARGKTPGSAAGLSLGVEALREFRVITNPFTAEYARVGGGVVNAVTKSGTNQLHGSVFLFERNDNFDARQAFDQEKPEFRRHQFGGAAGGPIVRDKTFFFGSYEGLRELKGGTQTLNVPDENARRGILPTGAVAVIPAVVPYLNFYPLPNGQNVGGGLARFIGIADRNIREDFFTVRVDHQLTPDDSLSGRYRFSDTTVQTPALIRPVIANTDLMRKQYATLEHTRIFSPTVLNSINVAFSRSAPIAGYTFEEVPRELWFVDWGRPTIGAIDISGGVAALGPSQVGNPLRFLLNTWQVNENLSITRGAHWMKMGANIYRFQYNGFTSSRQQGRYRFTSLANFLRGNVNNFEFALAGSAAASRGARSSIFGFFFQDDWKVLPNLTLNLGVRHEFYTTPTEAYGRVSNLRFPLDANFTVGDPFIENNSYDQIAPRVGFAWDIMGNGKTSLRGGWGLFYANLIPFNFSSMFQQNPPFYQIASIPNATFPKAAVSGAQAIPSFVFGLQYDMETPYAMQWGLQVQRELPWDAVVNIGYTGSRGVHLSAMRDNAAIPQILPDGRKFFPAGSRRRNPNFDTIRYQAYDANSFYHGLTIGLTKRYTSGLQFRTSYTFSKAIDESSTQGEAGDWANVVQWVMDPDDIHRERGLAAFHILHNLSISSTYDLPLGRGSRLGGWQMGGIFSASSGIPVNIYMTVNRARNAVTGTGIINRPDLAPGASNNPVRGGRERYFDPTAFVLPELGFFGNLGRNTLIGPGNVTFDFSVVKDTPIPSISEAFNVQFRAEFFNLFNRVNLSLPFNQVFDGSGPVATAGRIDDSDEPRRIQFSLKFIF